MDIANFEDYQKKMINAQQASQVQGRNTEAPQERSDQDKLIQPSQEGLDNARKQSMQPAKINPRITSPMNNQQAPPAKIPGHAIKNASRPVSSQKKSKSARRLAKKKEKKERMYHHVCMAKLAEAFEKQFFGYIKNNADQVIQADNLTVTKAQKQYSEIKIRMSATLKRMELIVWIFAFCSTFYLSIEIYNLVADKCSPTALGALAFLMSGNDLNQAGCEFYHAKYVTTVVWLNLLPWTTLLLLTILGFHFKSNAKLTFGSCVITVTYVCLIILGISVLAIIALNILYIINLTDNGATKAVFIILLGLVTAAMFLLESWYLIQIKKCQSEMFEFHNFLINYRQTPRSRIFKRHLPSNLDPVMEAESYLEKSMSIFSTSIKERGSTQKSHTTANVLSQSQVNRFSKATTQFRYDENDECHEEIALELEDSDDDQLELGSQDSDEVSMDLATSESIPMLTSGSNVPKAVSSSGMTVIRPNTSSSGLFSPGGSSLGHFSQAPRTTQLGVNGMSNSSPVQQNNRVSNSTIQDNDDFGSRVNVENSDDTVKAPWTNRSASLDKQEDESVLDDEVRVMAARTKSMRGRPELSNRSEELPAEVDSGWEGKA